MSQIEFHKAKVTLVMAKVKALFSKIKLTEKNGPSTVSWLLRVLNFVGEDYKTVWQDDNQTRNR